MINKPKHQRSLNGKMIIAAPESCMIPFIDFDWLPLITNWRLLKTVEDVCL